MEAFPKLFLVILMPVIILVSGCISGLDAEVLAKASPIVQDFLKDHPNADILATHFTENQSGMMLEEIREECANPYIEAKEFYRVRFTDDETGFQAVVWIDWEAKKVECAFKKGEGSDVIENCTSHYEAKCYGQHVYWFDSCGYKQEKKEYCQYGCENGECKPEGECKSHAEAKCYGGHVYWFDSCGHKQDKKEYCEYGCELGFCKEKGEECTSKGYKCTSAIRGCGHHDKFEYSCDDENLVCCRGIPYCGDGVCFESNYDGETAENCPEDCSEIQSECTSRGYICTSAIRRCGHHDELEYSCESEFAVCCRGTPYCGDGVCFESNYFGETAENCPEDCGAVCTDSDGGKNYYLFGETSSTSATGGGHTIDTCEYNYNTSRNDILVENYCDSEGNIKLERHICPNGCEDGACVEHFTQTECVTSPCTIYSGKTKTVTIEGDEYEVSFLGTSTHTSGIISINDVPKEVEEGNYYGISGLEVRVEDVDHKNSSSVLVAMGSDPIISIIGEYATLAQGVYLSTNERGLFVGDNLNSARDQLTADDLPDMLESGVFNDYYNNDYPYTQHIILGSSKIYDNYIGIGTDASDPLYTSKIDLTTALNFSSPDVNSLTEEMELFGRNYIVLPDSTNDAVELFESYHSFSVNDDENTTITFEGDDFKFEMLGYTETEAVLRINGNDVTWEEGKTYTLPGSTVRVHVSDVTTIYAPGPIHSVFMRLGRPVSLKNNEKVEVNYEDVPGTLVNIEKTGGKVSSISVSVAGQDSDKIYSGEDYEDPAWETFRLVFVHPTTLKSSIEIKLEKA